MRRTEMPDPSSLSSASSWRLSFPEPDIACLCLDTPGTSVNVLNVQTLQELDQILDRLDARTDVCGLIIASGKPGTFLAGADIRAIGQAIDGAPTGVLEQMHRCRAVLRRLAASPYVTVAAVDGICLGGGAELACWCDRRVLADGGATQLGFPEIELGLVPGWGGTARLPRLVGLDDAAEMIALNRRMGADRAEALGLADEVVSTALLVPAAIAVIRHELRSASFRTHRQCLAGPMAVSQEEVRIWMDSAARAIEQKWHGRRPAATVALRVLQESVSVDVESACDLAARAFVDLLGTPTNRALLNVYWLGRHNKRDSVVPADTVAGSVEQVGVVGAGIMGIGIAAGHLKHGFPVHLADASDEALSRAMAEIQEEWSACQTAPETPDVNRLLVRAESLDCLADCGLIVETVVETAEVKRRIYQQLETRIPPETIVVSNTSTIPISSLARGLEHPGRFCGMHFFNPVPHRRLVEVVRGDQTTDQTVATVVQHAKRIGKMPIVVHDSPGFLVNRLLASYLNESLELLIAGATIQDIDGAAERFGMPWGPLALIDLVGVDTSFFAGRTLWEAFPDRIAVLPVLPALFRKGRLGRKSGAGFYRYPPGASRGELDPAVAALLEPYVRRVREIPQEEITERLFLPMLLEATRLLEAGVVRDVRDVDLGLIYGLGFPADRGGLLFWADSLGTAQVVAMLESHAPSGSRFQPTPWLLEMASRGGSFYEGVPDGARVRPGGTA
jgi:3-hydroxyacyl-CoA dehydrogenase/enoyl-CoA hydratase/carnithine racemase